MSEREERWNRIAELAARLADALDDVPYGEGPWWTNDTDTYAGYVLAHFDEFVTGVDSYAKKLAREAGGDE